MKGIIVFYLNRVSAPHIEQEQLVQLMVKINAEVIKSAKEDGYETMFVTTEGEASRVEKIDFDKPFPNPHNINKDEE